MSLSRGQLGERLLVTGGLGFIGSAFVRRMAFQGRDVLNLDLDTYAGDERRLPNAAPGHVCTKRVDLADVGGSDLIKRERPPTIVHFAAETHVTRSELDAKRFFRSNVEGTRGVLEAAEEANVDLVVHISTDEVYGPCADDPFTEDDKLPGEEAATSAYARSKALADDLARRFGRRIPVIVVRLTNCFGPWQHPEKAIARWTIRALKGQRIPVWGDGQYIRDWLFLDDACEGIEMIIARGEPGEIYNLGPQGNERTNLEIARALATAAGRSESDVYLTEYDRLNHDRRYAIDASKARALGWQPQLELEQRLADTVTWYRDNPEWWNRFTAEGELLYSDAIERRERQMVVQ